MAVHTGKAHLASLPCPSACAVVLPLSEIRRRQPANILPGERFEAGVLLLGENCLPTSGSSFEVIQVNLVVQMKNRPFALPSGFGPGNQTQQMWIANCRQQAKRTGSAR